MGQQKDGPPIFTSKTNLAVASGVLCAQDVTRLCETRPLGERLRLQKGIQTLKRSAAEMQCK